MLNVLDNSNLPKLIYTTKARQKPQQPVSRAPATHPAPSYVELPAPTDDCYLDELLFDDNCQHLQPIASLDI